MKKAALVSLAGYLPGTDLLERQAKKLGDYLRDNTLLKKEYIAMIEGEQKLPGYVETNYDGWISQPWYDAWLQQLPEKKRSNPFQGAEERRRVPMDPTSVRTSTHPHPMLPSDAETIAGAMALLKWGKPKEEIDLVLVHSQVQDRPLPSNASLVQHKLQLTNAGAYTVDSCCSTFVTMVEVASALVNAGVKKNVLVVNSILDSMINDKSTYYSICTGDAACAAVITAVEGEYGYEGSFSLSRGELHDGIVFHHRSPMLHADVSCQPSYAQDFVTFMNPEACRTIGAKATEYLEYAVEQLEKKTRITRSQAQFLVTHQPVGWAPLAWRDSLGFTPSQHLCTYEKYGNIATCSVPTNLLLSIERGMVKAGQRVLMASSGAGENHIALYETLSPELEKNVLDF
ncbi:3-oxoacyl-[acyl-carrier-protein] synthase III C-terminal domain-containing protein [uncultured Acetobacteroides sp.]|uniref:3-oxoacyl-ACP synthase III family protein n=1 Tax=uncultured Acetobacteroides sp. TaxID=1760811 RepID=UPI0029F592DE|nr:3-oxoacyl-[acyl-carrier-protein] synthase III C-terminal domain-containing protein [uncultured Acetobacteroides sp.]